jgi:RPA family protein
MSSSSGSPGREVARRLFASEFNDIGYVFTESDDDMAPNYALLPTGAKANRVYFVGTLTDTEDVGSDDEYWQARVVDPTETFYVYAGQYQPEAVRVLSKLETPEYVAVVGKPRTYETDTGMVNVAIRPESITVVDEPTRERWVIETAEQTLDRLEHYDNETNDYARMVDERYTTSLETYREEIITALESLDEADDGSTADDSGANISDADAPGEDAETTDTDDTAIDTEASSTAGTDEAIDDTTTRDVNDESNTNADADTF